MLLQCHFLVFFRCKINFINNLSALYNSLNSCISVAPHQFHQKELLGTKISQTLKKATKSLWKWMRLYTKINIMNLTSYHVMLQPWMMSHPLKTKVLETKIIMNCSSTMIAVQLHFGHCVLEITNNSL